MNMGTTNTGTIAPWHFPSSPARGGGLAWGAFDLPASPGPLPTSPCLAGRGANT
jgi:hypothetical protein